MHREFVDLFCGAGGFSLGFKSAGFKHKFGIDNWDKAVKTYEMNIGECLQDDVMVWNEMKGADIIIGSPPCQDFSSANTRNRACDMTLTNKFMEIVKASKPIVGVMENVPNIIDMVQAPYKYTFDMADYGLLQRRRRCFCSNIPLEIPKVEKKWLNKEQVRAISEFRADAVHSYYQTITCRYNSFSRTNPHIVEGIKIRVLSHEEAMAVQTFPFDFKLPEGLTQRDKEMLVGNAVPPAFAYKVALCIKRFLDRKEKHGRE